MFQQGNWVKIKYGKYSGGYGRVLLANSDGSCKVLPYYSNNESGETIELAEDTMSLIEPMVLDRIMLMKLARADLLYRDIADKVFPIFNIEAEEDYPITSQDIAAALRNIRKGREPLSLFKEWFWLIQNILYKNLDIEDRYIEGLFRDAPENEDELFSTVYQLTENLYWKLEERFVSMEDSEKYIVKFDMEPEWNDNLYSTVLEETAFKAVCEDIESRVRLYDYNSERPRSEWLYSRSQKKHIIGMYEDEKVLQAASKKEKALYRKCVIDLNALGDTQATKILAQGYFEGNCVFKQSFKQAEKYLLKQYKATGDPYAANTLGYIYYYALADKDAGPQFGKAFKFFSYAALAGLDEAICYSADMLIHGQGTVKNVDMGMNLIVDGYKDTLMAFNDGEFDNRFADYAYRMGRICMENVVLGMGDRDAYKFLLEAEFAINKRRTVKKIFGDEMLEQRIRAELAIIRDKLKPDMDKCVLKADFPIYISHVFEDRFPVKVSITKEKGDYILKMGRFRIIPGHEPKILVTFPELSYVELVSELKFRLEDVTAVKVPEKGDTFLADGFSKNEMTNALEFYSGGECIAAIDAQWFVIDVTMEKALKRMIKGDKS